MIIVKHRVNTVEDLKKTPRELGIEIDIRESGGKLVLSHEAFEGGTNFEEFLTHYSHAFMIIDVKEEGIEGKIIELMKKHGIIDYFLLNVNFPTILELASEGFRNMSARLSEYESIPHGLEGKCDWLFIETFTKIPFDTESYKYLKEHFKLCLLSPDRFGRPEDIPEYAKYMKENGMHIDAVLTKRTDEWLHLLP